MLNLSILIGNVTGDVRYNNENRSVAQFQLAVDRGYIGSDDEKADFLPIVSFDELADIQNRLCRRGRLVLVVGKTQTRRIRRDGRDEKYTEVIADYIRYLDEPPSVSERGTTSSSRLDVPPHGYEPRGQRSAAHDDRRPAERIDRRPSANSHHSTREQVVRRPQGRPQSAGFSRNVAAEDIPPRNRR